MVDHYEVLRRGVSIALQNLFARNIQQLDRHAARVVDVIGLVRIPRSIRKTNPRLVDLSGYKNTLGQIIWERVIDTEFGFQNGGCLRMYVAASAAGLVLRPNIF